MSKPSPKTPAARQPGKAAPRDAAEDQVDEAVDEVLPGERSAELDADPQRRACAGRPGREAAPTRPAAAESEAILTERRSEVDRGGWPGRRGLTVAVGRRI